LPKNLKDSGRQILLKIPEVYNTISDKIGGVGGGTVPPPPSSSLFFCHERTCCFVNWPLVIGYWALAVGYWAFTYPQRTHFNDLFE